MVKTKDIRNSFHLFSGLYFDGGAGTPVLRCALDGLNDYYIRAGGTSPYGTFGASKEATDLINAARKDISILVNSDIDSVCLVGSATGDIKNIARYLQNSGMVKGDDAIIATALDHESNIHPWKAIAKDNFHLARISEDGGLDMGHLEELLTKHNPKVVTFPLAANTTGTAPNQEELIKLVRSYREDSIIVGDAVHYAPHDVMDFKRGFDILVFSLYKMWNPHGSVAVVEKSLLEKLDTGKMPQISGNPPYLKMEEGNQCWGSYAAASRMTRWVRDQKPEPSYKELTREQVVKGIGELRDSEMALFTNLIEGLGKIHGVEIYGIKDGKNGRVPTVAFSLNGKDSQDVVNYLMEKKGLQLRAGHFYAREAGIHYGLVNVDYRPINGGFIRASISPYHREKDVEKLVNAVESYSRKSQ